MQTHTQASFALSLSVARALLHRDSRHILVLTLTSSTSICSARWNESCLCFHDTGPHSGGCLHTGNLLRTADGKICILDFGLMTEVAPERRIALVEYIAHLSVQDWNGVAKDLVNLGFTPEGMPPMMAHVQLFSSSLSMQYVRMRSVSKGWSWFRIAQRTYTSHNDW